MTVLEPLRGAHDSSCLRTGEREGPELWEYGGRVEHSLWYWGWELETVVFFSGWWGGVAHQRPSYLRSNIVCIDLNVCKPSRPIDQLVKSSEV